MVIGYDPLGFAIIQPTAMPDRCRHDLRKTVHKLLAEYPAAILIDLSEVSQVPRLVQMTLLSLAIDAAQEPAIPMAFCNASPEVARDLTQNGPMMRVFTDVAQARRALLTGTPGASWIHRTLGGGSDAPSAAAGHVAEACGNWGLFDVQQPARTVAFHLVNLARGPYLLHLTLSLRAGKQLLINVRNYSTVARSSPQRSLRLRLSPTDEARIMSKGAIGCGRLVTGAGVAWWSILRCGAMSAEPA